jgi:hypothetical protein
VSDYPEIKKFTELIPKGGKFDLTTPNSVSPPATRTQTSPEI